MRSRPITDAMTARCDLVKIEGLDRHVFVPLARHTWTPLDIQHSTSAKVVTTGRAAIEHKITDAWLEVAKECATIIGKETLGYAGMLYHQDEVLQWRFADQDALQGGNDCAGCRNGTRVT